MNVTMDDLLVLPETIDLCDLSEDEVLSGSAGASKALLDQSVHALHFDPDEEALVTSTQAEGGPVPVVFTGLGEGARDSHAEDPVDMQLAFSTKNAPEPEEEQSNFLLWSSSSDEGAIPAAQPRYKVKDMWW